MTTLQRYQGMDRIVGRLDDVRQRHLLVQVAQAVAGLATVVLASLIVLGAVGFWPGQPPTMLRWALLLAAIAAWAAAAAWFATTPVRRRLNLPQAARMIEDRVSGLDNGLINALQLSADPAQPSPWLVQNAIHETHLRTARTPLASAVNTRGLRRWAISVVAAGLMLAMFAVFFGPRLSRGLAAVFDPAGYARHIGSVKLISLKPGDTACFAGQTLTIVAKIENPSRRQLPAKVEIRPADSSGRMGQASFVTAFPSADRTSYSCPLGKVQQSFNYAVWIGDSKFPADRPYYQVKVLKRVEAEGLDLLYRFPGYTNLPDESVVNASGPIEAPIGTEVRVTLRLSAPVPKAVLQLGGGKQRTMQPGADRKSFSASVNVVADDAYRILLTDAAGSRLGQLPDPLAQAGPADAADGFYPIRAVPDAAPTIAFVQPNRDVSVAPGGKLATRLRACDDYALAHVRFFLGREAAPAGMVKQFDDAAGKPSAELLYTIEVTGQYRQGEVLVYYAVAADGRYMGELGGPQVTESSRFKITVQDAAKVALERARRYEQLHQRLLAILKKQEVQRVNTEIAAGKDGGLAAVRATGGRIVAGQSEIRADVLELVDKFPFEPEMLTIQQALALLGGNEAAVAIAQARALAGVSQMDGRGPACAALADTQDRIIRSLQTLLAILPSLANPDALERAARGQDMPAQAKEQLAALSRDLERFIDEQRKIIDASQRLTKQPVDSFTPEQEQLLKQLELAQDQWEKFLNEKFTDFSKLAQQDFSNPALLAELISIKTDVTMAKDALSKKAIEIATAIEDNGIENAKTLTVNIEKWLPDEPDRIKWSMEDPAAQENIEQPELPEQLEDLVGELLEDQEDLFEEMDDVTGKYAMSGDRAIGWDAMDGPISNMNAQGVTGNQLPNTSEISGRSGEGRQGKATGEFVEDKAVGKGGRRTPTRLTNEPFQQGQINDTSKQPPGGATGGGKLSGAGSEGLEGPLPPELKHQLRRLAGRQAQLRNKAERIGAGFKVADFSNYQFLKAVTLMKGIEHDLANYRYVNALRRRDVTLGALRRTQLLLAGEIDVTADATPLLPKHVTGDVADVMKRKLPPEFEEALQRYFTRIAEAPRR